MHYDTFIQFSESIEKISLNGRFSILEYHYKKQKETDFKIFYSYKKFRSEFKKYYAHPDMMWRELVKLNYDGSVLIVLSYQNLFQKINFVRKQVIAALKDPALLPIEMEYTVRKYFSRLTVTQCRCGIVSLSKD